MRTGLLVLLLVMAPLAGCMAAEDQSSGDESPRTVEPQVGSNTSGETQAPPSEEQATQTRASGSNGSKVRTPALTFTAPTELTTDANRGFEPSIELGPEGTVYITAHKANRTYEDDQLASWLWYSTDQGASWSEIASPADLHEKQPAQEGEIAVDDRGRLYFVDTYLADVTVSRWAPGPDGPTWEHSRPIMPTEHAVDDRPWLAAGGDGTVYYLAHGLGLTPRSETVPDGPPVPGDRSILHRSTDGGLTFQPVMSMQGIGWCTPAVDPTDAAHVAVGCSTGPDADDRMVAYSSSDRGETWTRTELPAFGVRPDAPIPAASAIDRAGTEYHAWVADERGVSQPADDAPGQLRLARSTGDGFDMLDVPAPNGSLSVPWLAAGDVGTVALLVHAADTLNTTDGADWFPYAIVSANATAAEPDWSMARLTEAPVATTEHPPADFSQIAVGPENTVHVAFGAEDHPCALGEGCYESRLADSVYHVRQLAGPNVPSAGSTAGGT